MLSGAKRERFGWSVMARSVGRLSPA